MIGMQPITIRVLPCRIRLGRATDIIALSAADHGLARILPSGQRTGPGRAPMSTMLGLDSGVRLLLDLFLFGKLRPLAQTQSFGTPLRVNTGTGE